MQTDVSIILINYNCLPLTIACIESIRASTKGVSYEILVVDNGSSDGSRDILSAIQGIKFIDARENIGFGRANNLALASASGRNIIFLNNDTFIRKGNPIKELSDFLDSHPETGGCGANLVSADECPSVSFSKKRPSVLEEIARFLDIPPKQFNCTGTPVSVDVISGADLMVKRSVLDEVGGFNPSFFMYYEDTELCYRIKKAGYKLFCVPQAEIVHIGGASTKSDSGDSLNIKRMKMKFASRRQYYMLTRSKFHFHLSEFVWRCTVYSRLAIHCFNKNKRAKWSAYRKYLT